MRADNASWCDRRTDSDTSLLRGRLSFASIRYKPVSSPRRVLKKGVNRPGQYIYSVRRQEIYLGKTCLPDKLFIPDSSESSSEATRTSPVQPSSPLALTPLRSSLNSPLHQARLGRREDTFISEHALSVSTAFASSWTALEIYLPL